MPLTAAASSPRQISSGRNHDPCRHFSERYRSGLVFNVYLWRLGMFIALVPCLLACAGMSAPPHIGKTSRPENRVPLASLPAGETTWRAKDLDVHYKAVRTGDGLEISGFIEFGSNLGKFPLINYFRIHLHFIDADGRVLDSKLLWATGRQTETRFVRWTFQRQWPIPPGAAAMGFSYRGAATEAGGDSKFGMSKTGWEVEQQP